MCARRQCEDNKRIKRNFFGVYAFIYAYVDNSYA